ncbi:MAG TPA: hypothetical protein VKA15_13700 [Isosphaeraceae bacterium]|nr:hypothetical protein [Isosphaeraceae bacterium]
MPTDFDKGYMVGLLVGEGHFGGDGRQPQVTLRMHVRHEALFKWIERTFPGGKLYGPYNHDGRHYFQWMARGSYLREVLMPVLDEYLTAQLDAASAERYDEMKARYHRRLGVVAQATLEEEGEEKVSAPVPEREEHGGLAHLSGERLTATEIFDRLRREPPL